MLCKPRFFFFDANAFYKDADAKCPYDAHVSFHRCNFHDANAFHNEADAKCPYNAHVFLVRAMMRISAWEYVYDVNAIL